jgi:Glycosyl hydrolase family 12
MQLETQLLPLQVKDLASLRLKATWSTVVESAVGLNSTEQDASLDYNRVRSDVAIDMFLDQDEQRSTEFRPSIEVMVWFWSGKDIDPVGVADSNPNQDQFIVDGMRL